MDSRLIVNIDVPDLDKGIGFYRQALGFTLRRLLFDRAVAEMEGRGVLLHLIKCGAGSAAAPDVPAGRDFGAHWTPVHLDFPVPDVDAAVARALAAGARATAPVVASTFGRMARMRDPFGHGFCLIEFSDTGYDAAVSA